MLTARQSHILSLMTDYPGLPNKVYARKLGLSLRCVKGYISFFRIRARPYVGPMDNRISLFLKLPVYRKKLEKEAAEGVISYPSKRLTRRQAEVAGIYLIWPGLTYREYGDLLGISGSAIKIHLIRIRARLEAPKGSMALRAAMLAYNYRV